MCPGSWTRKFYLFLDSISALDSIFRFGSLLHEGDEHVLLTVMTKIIITERGRWPDCVILMPSTNTEADQMNVWMDRKTDRETADGMTDGRTHDSAYYDALRNRMQIFVTDKQTKTDKN